LKKGEQFKIDLTKIKVGNYVLPSSVSIGFIDSGTTYSYMSGAQKSQIDRAIKKLCESGDYNCLGRRKSDGW